LAGTLGELAHGTLKDNFRAIDPAQAQILLLEGAERILATFPPDLSAQAAADLRRLGVTVRTRTLVTDVRDSAVTTRCGDSTETIQTSTILWTAGVKSSPLGEALAKSADVALDRTGRVKVAPDLTIPGHPDIFVIGDLAHVTQQDGTPLPGLASVAIQEGRYVGKAISGNGSRGKPRWRSTIAIRATWPSSGAMRGWRIWAAGICMGLSPG
jgi:NADH dehydrogenase